MKTEDWEKVKEILNDALDLPSSERQQFVENRCAELAPEIRREVESLMQVEFTAESFFGSPAVVNFADLLLIEEDPKALLGAEIGNYKIIRKIGYGGMGVVYLAERNDGMFDKRVALKLLKPELNTENLRRRFQHERQILASLEHPNIARLLDAGTSPSGVPFLAMEYVEGIPIDEFCNTNELNLEQRLELFRTVCEAMAFSHRNLIVHRDLKPSNILVTQDGVPKLLDFGIAKLLSPEFDEMTQTVTKLGAMTPSYASPEQLKGESVTTATDIYSLGIILYELLAGRRPFENVEKNFQEILKAVCETDPPLPSAMISELGWRISDSEMQTAQTSVDTKSSNKATNPKSQIRHPQLKGDLDNIILKALKKEPERRYSTVESFAEDIRRYLTGLPVLARPDTFSYRAEKFIRRNRTSVVAGILILLAIIGGVAATLWQARSARLEAQKARKVSEYMQNVLNFSNPFWVSTNPKRNREAKISDALDEALKNIDTDLGEQPEIQGEILLTIAGIYAGQGQYDKALPLVQKSIEKFDSVFGENNPKSHLSYSGLATLYSLTGKQSEAEKTFLKTVAYYRANPGTNDVTKGQIVADLNDLGNVHNYNSNFVESEKYYREAIENFPRLEGKQKAMIPIILGNLAWLLHSQAKFDEAFKYYGMAEQEIINAGNQEQFEAGTLYNKIGVAYNEKGDYQQAEIYFQKAYDNLLKNVGEENLYTLGTMYRNAYNHYKQGKLDEAEKLVNRSLEKQRKILPNGHNFTAFSERLLGQIYTQRGDLNKGEELLRKALDWLQTKTKGPNRDISLAQASLGENLMAQKRLAEARELVTSAVNGSVKNVGEEHPLTKQYRELLSKIPE